MAKFRTKNNFGGKKRKRRCQLTKARASSTKIVAEGASRAEGAVPVANVPTTRIEQKIALAGNFETGPKENARHWCIVELGQVNRLIENVACPNCFNVGKLQLDATDKEHKGFSSLLSMKCTNCNEIIEKVYSSPKMNVAGKSPPFAINDILVLFFNQLGLGHTAMEKFGALLGIPGLHLKTFQEKEHRIINSIVDTTDEVMNQSRKAIREVCRDTGTVAEDGVVEVTVSYDGSWQKRGHTSLHGIAAVIEVVTGLVVDYEVLSKYCHACALKKAKGDDFDEWYEGHKPNCSSNYEGSSNAMEVEAAVRLWQRSLSFGFRYVGYLGDGDSKAFDKVCELKPYGNINIVKEDCINHAHKRMGTALLNLTKSAKLGGRGHGRLTKEKAIRFQFYYRHALTSGSGDVEKMRSLIWATLFHCMSSDEEPHHQRCPPGQESWCFFQRAVAQGGAIPPHEENVSYPLAYEVAQEMLPVYKRMSDPNLIQRLVRGKTQNPNECLHSVVWSRCSKTVFVGSHKLRGAVAAAVGSFNQGAGYLTKMMQALAIEENEITQLYIQQKDHRRVQCAKKESRDAIKQGRVEKGEKKKRERATQEAAEGVTYGAGIF